MGEKRQLFTITCGGRGRGGTAVDPEGTDELGRGENLFSIIIVKSVSLREGETVLTFKVQVVIARHMLPDGYTMTTDVQSAQLWLSGSLQKACTGRQDFQAACLCSGDKVESGVILKPGNPIILFSDHI